MRQFKDNSGRAWTVEINVATLKRVRGLTGVDLMQIIEGTLIEKFIRDPVLLCDVVYSICKPEADAACGCAIPCTATPSPPHQASKPVRLTMCSASLSITSASIRNSAAISAAFTLR